MKLAELIGRHGVEVLEHLDRQATVKVSGGLQFQGDVAVIPAAMVRTLTPASNLVPAAGVPVVRGEAGGNTHLLLGEGDVRFDPADNGGPVALALGTLTVAEGATAWLAHPEHAYTGVAPGTYELRRQREQADEIRLIAD